MTIATVLSLYCKGTYWPILAFALRIVKMQFDVVLINKHDDDESFRHAKRLIVIQFFWSGSRSKSRPNSNWLFTVPSTIPSCDFTQIQWVILLPNKEKDRNNTISFFAKAITNAAETSYKYKNYYWTSLTVAIAWDYLVI